MNDFDPEKYWEERLSKDYGLQSVGYLGLGKCYNKWLYRIRSRIFRRLVKTLDVELSSMNVLDIGSGTGFYINEWKQQDIRTITGSDITDIAIKNLKANFPDDTFHRMDIGAPIPEQPDNRYDIISAFDVLYHIVDDDRYKQAIRNIYSMLRDDGYFILSDNFLHKETLRGMHQVCHTLSTIEDILNQTGFRIVKRVPMFILMNYPCDSDSRILRLFWKVLSLLITRGELFGFMVGGILYPLEMILTRILKESPTTEIMICRRTS